VFNPYPRALKLGNPNMGFLSHRLIPEPDRKSLECFFSIHMTSFWLQDGWMAGRESVK